MILTPEHIEKIICREFSISSEQLKCKSRNKELVFARHLMCYLIKKYSPHYSLKSIGTYLKRDHTSVIHAIKCINNYLDSKHPLQYTIVDIKLKVDDFRLRLVLGHYPNAY